MNKLKRKIERLEGESEFKQQVLERLRREKVELENALEQEQEALVNRLWKKMKKLEEEKRILQVGCASTLNILVLIFNTLLCLAYYCTALLIELEIKALDLLR